MRLAIVGLGLLLLGGVAVATGLLPLADAVAVRRGEGTRRNRIGADPARVGDLRPGR